MVGCVGGVSGDLSQTRKCMTANVACGACKIGNRTFSPTKHRIRCISYRLYIIFILR